MKKFFRLVSVFAIAGVTFAYTSCTDYSEDIEVANGRISTLEGSVANLQSQVTSLQSTVSSLQTALTTAQNNITALQNTLSALEAKHDKDIADLEAAYKAADASLKKTLEDQITALQNKHNQDVQKINQDIAALQTLCGTLGDRITALEAFKTQAEALLPTLATKAELEAYKKVVEAELAKLLTKEEFNKFKKDVEEFEAWTIAQLDLKADKADFEAFKAEAYATFATKEALAEVEKTLGQVDGRLKVVEDDLETLLDETVPDIYDKIQKNKEAAAAAQKAAEDAQADATKALGEIAALRDALGVYAEKGKLEATIAALIQKDSALNAAIIELVAQDEAFKIDIKNLQNKDVELAALIDSLSQRGLFYDAAIAALQTKDAELDRVDAKHDSLIGVLEATKLNIADFQEYFDKAVTEAVKDDGIVGQVINQKVQTAKTEVLIKLEEERVKLQNQITTLKTYTETEIAKINGIFPERLTSIVFVPQYYVDGIDAILFETLAYNGMKADENSTASEDQSGLVSKYKFNVSAETTAKYRFSPKTVGIDCADWDFVGNVAETRVVAPEAPIQIVGTPKYDATTGEAVFTVEKKENVKFQEGNKIDIVALKATLKTGLTDAEKVAEEKPVVFSEYERVVEDIIYASNLAISDSTALVTNAAKYPTVATEAWQKSKLHEYTKTFNAAKAGAPVYKMAYNEDFDLGKLVATCINKNGHTQLDLAKFGLYYKFSVASSKYELPTVETITNQQTNIKCVDEVNGIYRTTGTYADGTETEYNKESIGRTPIVKIELMHGDQVVTRAFVKLEICVVHQDNILVVDDTVNYVYGSAGCGKDHELVIDVETMRARVYRVCNISHEEFWNTYEIESSVVTKNGEDCNVTPPTLRHGTTNVGVATKEVVWKFNDSEVGTIGNGAKLVAVIKLHNKLANSSTYPEYVTFQFEFNYTLPDYTAFLDVVKKDIFWKDDVLQVNVNYPLSTTDVAENCWFNSPIEKQPWYKFEIDFNKRCIESATYKIVNIIDDGVNVKKEDIATFGVELGTFNGEVSIKLDKTSDKVKKALNSLNGLQAEVDYVITLETGDELTIYKFLVNFIRPLTLNMPEGLSVQDAQTGGDVIDFDFTGLLVDWRGEAVLPPYWSEEQELRSGHYWNKVCSPADHAVVIPGYQRIDKPAKWNIVFADVTVTIPAGEKYTVYTAKVPYHYSADILAWYIRYGTNDHIWVSTLDMAPTQTIVGGEKPTVQWVVTRGNIVVSTHDMGWIRIDRPTAYETYEAVGQGRSADEAKQNAIAEVKTLSEYFDNNELVFVDGCQFVFDNQGIVAEITSEELYSATGTTEFTFKNMVSATYTPAKYEDVPSRIEYSKCNFEPSYDGEYDHQRVGCWEWTPWQELYTWDQLNPGQYWDFYGPIKVQEYVELDLENVTTDLADHKLPSQVSLEQVGNTLKYFNAEQPIQYPYHIYIPATVEYGWGVLTSTMTITVNPVATIAQ